MVPWFDVEITPRTTHAGVSRFDLDPADARRNVRAVVEAQMASMARHSGWMGVDVKTIVATGGASANRDLLQVMADVFGAEVVRLETTNSAGLGAALRAWHADLVAEGRRPTWTDIVAGFADPVGEPVRPNAATAGPYADFKRRYAECEAEAIGTLR
jgi:xylulokinase